MILFELDKPIERFLEELNDEAGGGAKCEIVVNGFRPYLRTVSWSGSDDIGMVENFTESPCEVASLLDLKPSCMFYGWVRNNGRYAIGGFDSAEERANFGALA